MSKNIWKPADCALQCRICLKTLSARQLINLFKLKDNIIPASTVSKLGDIEIIEGDGLPQQICPQCYKRVYATVVLTQEIQESDKCLRNEIYGISSEFVKTEIIEDSYELKPEVVYTDNYEEGEVAKVDLKQEAVIEENVPEIVEKKPKIKRFVSNNPKCCMCRFICETEKELVSHVKENHPDPKHKTKESYKSVQCQYCFKGFLNNRTYVDHFRKPYIERNHQCLQCGQMFAYKSDLTQHELTHTEVKEVICEICKKLFRSEKNLRRHMKVHDEKNKLQCDLCSRLFAEKKQLEYHMKSHINIRDCICAVCGRGFVHNTLLKLHMRKHTGERPHKCNICSKSYKHNTDLRRHKYEHEGVKPFKCSYCDRTFYQRSNMKVHERVHTGDCPFSCTLCGQKFKFHAHWKQHEKKFHGLGQPILPSWLI